MVLNPTVRDEMTPPIRALLWSADRRETCLGQEAKRICTVRSNLRLLEHFAGMHLMKAIMAVTAGAGFSASAAACQFIADTDVTVIDVDEIAHAGNLDSLPGVMGYPRDFFEQVDTCDARQVAGVFQMHQPDRVSGTVAEARADHSVGARAECIETKVPYPHYLQAATRPDLGKQASGLQVHRGITWITRHSQTLSGEGLHSQDFDLSEVYA